MSVGNIVWTREETSLKVKRVGTLYQVKLLGWTMHTSWKDLVAGNHTAGHVIADVTVKKPDAGIVWDHVDRFH